jgi:hypothetical protein
LASRRSEAGKARAFHNLSPDIKYDEALKLCESLGLIETVKHGDHQYGRLTQKGVNTFVTLLRMMHLRSFPELALKES